MKRCFVYIAAVLAALSLAACSPTQVADEDRPTPLSSNPEGLTPEIVEEYNAEQADDKYTVDPDAPVRELVMIYYPVSESSLDREFEDVDELTAEAVVDWLIAYGILEEDTGVNSFDIEGGIKAGPGADASAASSGERKGTLDLTQLDEAADNATIYSIGNTFCENFELDNLEILVNGSEYTTVDYLEKYDSVPKN